MRPRLMVGLLTRVNRCLFVGLALLAGCRNTPPAEPTKALSPYLTIFLVDGMVQEILGRELTAGRLPNMEALVREGTLVKNGISSFPSMTGYGFYPFITGEDAARSGILGLRWLDRDAEVGLFRNYVGRTYGMMNGDLVAEPRTIYEVVGDAPTHTWNSYMNRGARDRTMAGARFSLAKYRDAWWLGRLLSHLPGGLSPTFAEVEGAIIDAAIVKLDETPKVQWVTFTAPDGFAHIHGIGDDGYVARLHEVDALIGRYREASRALGQEADRVYAVVTDHGLAQVNFNVDLASAMTEQLGVAMFRGEATEKWSADLSTTPETFAAADGVVAINGNTMAHVYLQRRGVGFREPMTALELRAYGPPTKTADTLDVIAGLRRIHGIELVVARGSATTIEVFGAEGEGTISAGAGGYGYAARGVDPLGYADDAKTSALMDGGLHDGRLWMEASMATQFPDALHRLVALFASADTGDVVVTAISGYDLAAEYEMVVGSYRGGHGGLRADQLRVSYILSGHGVRRRGYVESARAEDVGATLRAVMGLPLEASASGVTILGALE